MGDDQSASVIRTRAFVRLKKALTRAGLSSTVEPIGMSRAVLHVAAAGIDIHCRANPRDSHRWWFWLDDEPIAATDDLAPAVQAIKRKHASEVTP